MKVRHVLSRGAIMQLSIRKARLSQVEKHILVTTSLIQPRKIWETFRNLWASVPPLPMFSK